MTPMAVALLTLMWHGWNAIRVWEDARFGTFIFSLVSSLLLISCEVTGSFFPLLLWEGVIGVLEVLGVGFLLLALLRQLDPGELDGEVVTRIALIFSGTLTAQGGRFALCFLLSHHLATSTLP